MRPKKNFTLDGRRSANRRARIPGARPPLVRMVKIHELLRSEAYPNCRHLAAEFEVSAKTIQRDIDFMRDQLELPIDYDSVKHGFRYTKQVTNFPMLTVTQGELVALLVAQKAMEQYRGTAFEKPLEAAFSKLASSLREETGISLHDLSEAFSFRPSGVAQPEMRVFRALSEAVMETREIEFEYLALRSKRPEARRVQPHHLGCVDNQWYLFAYDLMREDIRTFALTRISQVKDMRRKFQRSSKFSPAALLKGSFGAFETEKVETIKIRLDAFAARLAEERKWHASQKLSPLENGDALMTLQVGIAPDLEKWILSWGEHAEVVSPKALRDKIAQQVGCMAKTYEQQKVSRAKSGSKAKNAVKSSS